MLPESGLLLGVGIGAGLGAAIVLLIAALRGVNPQARNHPPGGWQIRLQQARSAIVSVRAGIAGGVGVLILVLTRWPVAAAAMAALILLWPYLFGGLRAENLAVARLEALVVWTESLRDTLSANASLEQAIAASTQRAPLLIQPALARLAGQLRVQTPLDAALLDLAEDLQAPGADLVIAALVLSVRRRGDRLAQVLSGLSTTAREELDLRRRVTAGRAGIRRSVQIIVVITVTIAGYLTFFGGAFMDPYDNVAGQLALAVVVALFAAGFAWMRHLGAETETTPLLTPPGRSPDPGQARIVAALTGIPADQAPLTPTRRRRPGPGRVIS